MRWVGHYLLLLGHLKLAAAPTESPYIEPIEAVQLRKAVIGGKHHGDALIVSAQLPSSWQHQEGWTTWSVPGVIKRCDGTDDPRLWYSVFHGRLGR